MKKDINREFPNRFKRKMEGIIRLVGIFGLIGFLGYLGYLMYDKNTFLGVISFVACLVLSIYTIHSEIEFKRIRHKAPWNFSDYQER